MKKLFIIGIIIIAAIFLVVQISREEAKINREAIEALPASNPDVRNTPRTREELQAQEQRELEN